MSVNQNKKTKKWYFRCEYRDAFGVLKTKYKAGFDSSRKAKDAESDFYKKTRLGSGSEINIRELSLVYLDYQKKRLRPSTYASSKQIINSIMIPFWKNVNIDNLNMKMISEWQEHLLALKYNKQGNLVYYSNSQLDKIQGVFSSMMNFALTNGYAEKNITRGLKRINHKHEFKKEMDFFTLEEFKQFISVVDDEMYYNLFSILYWCGTRLGETLALTWNDINFFNGTIRINKTYSPMTRTIVPPKTANSYRTIYYPTN